MPKPFMGVSANGCHHNFSLWRGEENTFLPDTDNPRLPGVTGLRAVAGVLEHLSALCAISSPTVNSYRRFADTGFWAPVFTDWGFQNRTTALRVARRAASSTGRSTRQSTRTCRWPPCSWRSRTDSTATSTRASRRSATSTRRSRRARSCGGSRARLGEALEALQRDELVKTALPGDMYRVFMHYKTDEWERFISTVSDWDIKEYLDVLP